MAVIGRDLFLNAAQSHGLIQKAIATFEEYLRKPLPPKSPQYYQARNYLREGQKLFDETLKKARVFLGPASPYAPREIEEQRARFLLENKFIVRSRTPNLLREELARDEILATFYRPEEIAAYLESHFVSQSSGKRKLADIKMRMILDKLNALSAKGLELQAAAQKYFQT